MNDYNGDERRLCPDKGACLDHAGFNERIKTNERVVKHLVTQNYVPFSNYKWMIALLTTIFVSLFTIAIYLSLETNKSLQTIVIKQEITIHTISKIEEDIKELKRRSTKP